jgi:hypothetical protein
MRSDPYHTPWATGQAQWGSYASLRSAPGEAAADAAEPGAQQRALAALLVALLSLTGVLALGDPERGALLVGYALLAGVVAMWMAVTARVRASKLAGSSSPTREQGTRHAAVRRTGLTPPRPGRGYGSAEGPSGGRSAGGSSPGSSAHGAT